MINNKDLVCICADDFGLSDSINEGILDLVKKRKIQAVSCIVNKKPSLKYFSELKKHSKYIDIGLHLNLTETKSGATLNFKSLKNFFLFLSLLVSKKEIEEEIDNQIKEFAKYFNCKPNYIDGHHHIHQFPIISNIILKKIKKTKLFVRCSGDHLWSIIFRKQSIFKSLIINIFATSLKKKLKLNNLDYNLSFSGIYNFKYNKAYSLIFNNFLKYRSKKHIIMCHPAKNKVDTYNDSILNSRLKEYKFFMSNNFVKIINKNKIILSRLSKF